jgi:hypothetical protein
MLVRAWSFFLLKINHKVIKKIILGVALLFFGLYFFPDWENYIQQIINNTEDAEIISLNIDKLFYLKVTKYIYLILLISWIFYNLFSLSLSNKTKVDKKNEIENLKKQKVAEESIETNEDYFDQLEDTDLYPNLKTKAENILDTDK